MKEVLNPQRNGLNAVRGNSEQVDQFAAHEFRIGDDHGGLRQGARHLPFHEGDTFAGMVLGIVEVGQIVNRGHRRAGKRHQDVVRGVQYMVFEVSSPPAEQLAAGKAVQVKGEVLNGTRLRISPKLG